MALASCVGAASSVDPGSQFGDLVDWAFHLTLWSSARMGFSATDASTARAVVGVSMATYAGAVRVRAGKGSVPRAMANSVQIGAFFVAARLLATNLRSTDRAIDVANEQALHTSAEVATEQARAAAMEHLHAGALESVQRIEELWSLDRRAARLEAGSEALRLRQAVHGSGIVPHDLRSGLEERALALARQGVQLELHFDIVAPVDQVVSAAAIAAVETTVLELSGASSASPPCTVRVVSDEAGLVVRVRDQSTELEGSELRRALEGIVDPVDGSADVWSAPGRGTRVVLKVGSRVGGS